MIILEKQYVEPIKLTKDELNEVIVYLRSCYRVAFSGIYNFKHMIERERMYQWHLNELFIKVAKKYLSTQHKPAKAKITIKLNEIELHTMSVLFKRVDCSPLMLALQQKFNSKLVKFN